MYYDHAFLPPHKREPVLDFLKGIALVLMVFAHAVFFLHTNTDPILRVISRTGNTVAFTVFLFCSGAAAYLAWINTGGSGQIPAVRHVVKKILVLLAGYYTVAVAAVLKDLVKQPFPYAVSSVRDILVFTNVPRFSEFLIPFIVFSASLILFRRWYIALMRNTMAVLAVALVCYVIGVAGFLYPVPLVSRSYLALFFGIEYLLRFPIFWYAPVFLIGMVWGKFFAEGQKEELITRRVLVWGMVMLGVSGLSFLATRVYPLSVLDPSVRWPPSIGFLATGLSAVFFVSLLYPFIQRKAAGSHGFRYLMYLGRDSYDLFLVHILLLFLYEATVGVQFRDGLTVWALFIVLLVISSLLSSLNWRISPSVFTLGAITVSEHGRGRVRKRAILLILFALCMLIFQTNAPNTTTTFGAIMQRANIIPKTEEPLPESGQDAWYEADAGYVRQLAVRSTEKLLPILKDSVVVLSFDHASLVTAKKSDVNGGDLSLVYRSSDGYRVLPFILANANSNKAQLLFPLVSAVGANSFDNRYFLYYGNDFPKDTNRAQLLTPTTQSYAIDLLSEQVQDVSVVTNRRWFLTISLPGIPDTLTIRLTAKESGETADTNPVYSYDIDGADMYGILSALPNNQYSAEFHPIALPPGEYAIVIKKDGTRIGRRAKLIVSEPLLTSLTIDWEGEDVPDRTLSRFESIAQTYGNPPFTHFFNPRIYLYSVMPEERSLALTDWIRKRIIAGDELALHLHMHTDVVEAAGLVPKTEPRWGIADQDPGYDVPMSAYSYNEVIDMITWAQRRLLERGLPEPKGFRAGGWFADISILTALEDADFLYDSSGRDRVLWGGGRQSPWDLSSQSQPYYPSVENQNVLNPTGTSLRILEIPNNGGNTYEYSPETLRERFASVYKSGVLTVKQAVVLMSHLQWADREFPKLEEVLRANDAISFAGDKGPLVYTTTRAIYDLWK